MSKKPLFLFIMTSILNLIHCYVVFNLDLLAKENYKTSYELNSPKDIISKEIISSYFTEIELGTSFQKIPLIIKPKIADYVVASIHQMENPTKDYTSNKYVYNLTQNFNYFNENLSSSFNLVSCEKRSPLDEFEKPLAELTCFCDDTILLYTNKDLTEKKIMKEFYLELVRNSKDNITGAIGLNLNDMFNHVSILSLLKKNNLIDNYYWFFDFEKWDSNKGKLFMGSLPHDIYGNKYSKDDLASTPGAGIDYEYYKIDFDEIYYRNSTGVKEIIGVKEKAELNVESNVIIGKHNFREYLSLNLNDSINEGKCFFESLENYYEPSDIDFDYDFFYCKNTKEMKEQLNKIIPDIFFYSKNLNYNFELKKEQILKENGEYIYIYIIFCHQYNSWYLGKQISLKYQFIFNPDTKFVYFYKNLKKEDEKENNYLALKIVGIVVLCIIFGVLGVLIGKKIYGMRKKRANELKDDDFDYILDNVNDNHNNNALEKNK